MELMAQVGFQVHRDQVEQMVAQALMERQDHQVHLALAEPLDLMERGEQMVAQVVRVRLEQMEQAEVVVHQDHQVQVGQMVHQE
jgi:hypothetical protein